MAIAFDDDFGSILALHIPLPYDVEQGKREELGETEE